MNSNPRMEKNTSIHICAYYFSAKGQRGIHVISYWVSVKREAPLNMIPALPYKPTPTSKSPNYPSTRSVVSAPTSVFLQRKQGTLWAVGSQCSIEVNWRGPPHTHTHHPPPLLEEVALCENRSWVFCWLACLCFDEKKPLKGTARIHQSGRSTLLTVTDMQPLTAVCVLFLLLHISSGSAGAQR